MKALTDDQLWGKIRNLQGEVVFTPDRRRPNRVISVSEDLVELEDLVKKERRKSPPSKYYLVWCYHLATQHGILTERNLPAEFFYNRIARICMTLLADAVPKQIRAFRRREGPPAAQGLSGIEVYNKDC